MADSGSDDRDPTGRFTKGHAKVGAAGRPKGWTAMSAELRRLGDSEAMTRRLLEIALSGTDPKASLAAIRDYQNRTEGGVVNRHLSLTADNLPLGFWELTAEARVRVLRGIRERAVGGLLPQQVSEDVAHDQDE